MVPEHNMALGRGPWLMIRQAPVHASNNDAFDLLFNASPRMEQHNFGGILMGHRLEELIE